MSNAFTAPHFRDDEAARDLIASVRWPEIECDFDRCRTLAQAENLGTPTNSTAGVSLKFGGIEL